ERLRSAPRHRGPRRLRAARARLLRACDARPDDRLPLRGRRQAGPGGARPGHRVVLGDDPARRRLLPRRCLPPPRRPARPCAAAGRALRALARPVADDGRRALRRAPRGARQGPRRAGGPRVPPAPARAARARRRGAAPAPADAARLARPAL
ncbi:MAG: hypothetical protein AVDCRST_MAG13-899, partial [uncultured Solirubrobacteraceae bacterium]